jgi:anti-sigma-K factor RskA
MKADKMYFAEERRVWWTTYSNLELWFNSWEKTLLKLGFLEPDSSGKLNIPSEQLRNICDDERKLLEVSKTEITVSDTALGRAKARKEKELEQAALTMADEKWEQIVARWSEWKSLLDTTPDGGEDYELNLSLEGESGVV